MWSNIFLKLMVSGGSALMYSCNSVVFKISVKVLKSKSKLDKKLLKYYQLKVK